MKKILQLALIILTVIPDVNAQKMDREIQKIDSMLLSGYHDDEPGIAIAILKNGRNVYKKGFGLSSLQSKEKITSSTNFNIASLTKQFTAMAIQKLADSGKLLLSDTIAVFFPDMNKRVSNHVTVKQLLGHNSGIVDHYSFTDTTFLKHASNANVYAAIKSVDSLYFEPGTQFRYSNTAYCLLALIIEKISGQPFARYLQQTIFEPAGMKQTYVWEKNQAVSSQATGYVLGKDGKKFISSGPDENIFFSTEGDGGIYSSLEDYISWYRISIQFPASPVLYQFKEQPDLGYSYGWFVDAHKQPVQVYHSGSNGGFRSYCYTIPSQNYLLIILSNRSDKDVEELTIQINKMILPQYPGFTKIQALTN
jgi:D-alanyl-D-alanine carboxypeptidase